MSKEHLKTMVSAKMGGGGGGGANKVYYGECMNHVLVETFIH